LSAGEIAHAVNAGELDPTEVVQGHLEALEELLDLNAVITSCGEHALRRVKGRLRGPLAGVPLLVKDLFDTAGLRTTYGSAIYAQHVPKRTAAAVTLLEEAGAVLIGKANLHEFAWGTTSQNPHWGYVQNPVSPGLVAGGSSGGNAAALAAGVSALGLGTDTAGSVRIPAACCRIVGYKPSFGRVPLRGCLPLAPTFDVAGPMARNVRDCALAYSVLTGEEIPEPRIEGMVVGLLEQASRVSPHEPRGEEEVLHPKSRIEDYGQQLEQLGATVVEVELPEPEADVVPLLLFEAAVAHRRTFPARRAEYGPDTQLKWDAARSVPAIDVHEARLALRNWRRRARAEPAVDLLLSPTIGIAVPPIDVWEPDVRVHMVKYTRGFSFLGWPAIAVADFQLAGRDDATVLAAALALEEAGTTALNPSVQSTTLVGGEPKENGDPVLEGGSRL
jgi:Asp-tRNA(Asn)/Glu-tRNA(Gln) amidotransferase A subunit family amidase